jgi:hypothetical protein
VLNNLQEAVMPRRRAQPAEPREVTALEYYGAVLLRDLAGWWVYALGDVTDRHIFYAGQSANLLSRLRDHSYTFKTQFDPAQVWLVPCKNQADADRKELELIDYYQPEHNTVGRAQELERLVHGANKSLKPGHRVRADYLASLDSKQAGG